MSTLKGQFEFQKYAFQQAKISFYQSRKNKLKTLQEALLHYQEELCEAVNDDFGHRAKAETLLLEVFPAVENIKLICRHLHDWMRPKKVRVPYWLWFGSAQVIPEPKGIVGIVVPWNYPIHLAILPLVSAIAAGNSVMIKMSPLSPRTSKMIERILSEVFSREEVQLIQDDGSLSQEFIELPFNHLFFTGSVATGKKVMAAASANLTPVTLELGGKSPVLVAPDYSVETVANRVMMGKLINAGQTCIAPDYLFMRQGSAELLIRFAKNFVAKHYANIIENEAYTSIISQERFQRLEQLLEDAKAKGARIIPLCDECSHLEKRRFVPHLIFNVNDDMLVMQEEIFGPILPVMIYDDFSKAIAFVKTKPSPLALYIFDENSKRVNEIIDQVPAGGVTVNDVLLHAAVESLPFGGIGQSGMGQYHGQSGFDALTHYRSVFHQSSVNFLKLARPFFSRLIRRWKL